MKRALEVLAIAGHGAALVVHSLGVVFNRLDSGKWLDRDVAIHAAGVGFSGISLFKHVRRATRGGDR